MNKKIENIIYNLNALTLLESIELIKKIEEVFGVVTSTQILNNSGSIIEKITETPIEQTEFTLILEESPIDKKIPVLKLVRTLTGLGLRESKDLVEAAPKIVKEGMTKDAAEIAKKQFEEVGARMTIK